MGDESAAVERRLEIFIAAVGAVATAGALVGWGIRAAEGAAAGAALCWLNFRWLRRGAATVIQLGLEQAGVKSPRVPRSTQAKFFGRLGLLLLAAYAILVWLRMPAIPVLCGLTAIVPAILLEWVYETTRGQHRWTDPKIPN